MGPFLIFILLIACAEKRSIRPGVTSRSALVEMKGEPLKTEVVPSGEILTYKENEKFQISEDKVRASFRDPVGDERNVLFWRHHFRECEVKEIPLSEDATPEIELSCATLGKSVVFVNHSGKVSRISEYEGK
ncbi:MAG: hypothetical protein V4598_06935 [Bdellovibrionota bacterium]